MSRPATLTSRVVDGLKEQIRRGELRPGQRLGTERELVERFAVSRTVVREAVGRLQAEGLVETQQGRGSFVLDVPTGPGFTLGSGDLLSHGDVVAMLEFRQGVEPEAAALAARRASAGALAGLVAAHSEFVDSAAGRVSADFRFHRAVALAAGNRFYSGLIDSLGPAMIMMPRARLGAEFTMTDAEHRRRVSEEHEAVLRSIEGGDADAARAAMRLHLANSRARLAGR